VRPRPSACIRWVADPFLASEQMDILEMINGDGFAHGTYHWNRLFPQSSCTGMQSAVPCLGWSLCGVIPGAVGGIGGGSGQDNSVTGQVAVADWWTTYHEFASEWGPGYITFLVDGVVGPVREVVDPMLAPQPLCLAFSPGPILCLSPVPPCLSIPFIYSPTPT
jgi:hypothetical protein